MATMTKVFLALLFGLLATSIALAQSDAAPERLPRNVFKAEAKYPRYLQWWRPLRVVFDDQKVADIERRLVALPAAQAEYADLDTVLGEHKDSVFVFPVLAVQGDKGLDILNRWLAEYRQGRQFDDRWLLIIATLGRMPSPASQCLLEAELDRLFAEYDFEQRGSVPIVESYLPVIDALFGCLAGQGKLTVQDIERLAPMLRAREGLGWILALEWARPLMNDQDVLQLLEDCIAGCDDEDLRKAMNHEIASTRLRSIIGFLASPKSNWPITRSLLLRQRERRKTLDQFLHAENLAILALEGEASGGHYKIDEQLVNKFTAVVLPAHRGIAVTCWMLTHFEPSMHSPPWQAVLAEHSRNLDERDRATAQYRVDLAFGRGESPRAMKPAYDLVDLPEVYDKPGVHILGFTRAGGRHPVKLPAPK